MRYLVQDIETIPESEVAADWVPTEEEIKKANGKEPFPPLWANRVLTIGMCVLDQNMIVRKDGCAAGGISGGATEKRMVERWSQIASGEMFRQEMSLGVTEALRMVDFNGRGFDVPVLQYRAFRYGLELPWYFGRLPDNRGQISSYSKSYRDRYHGHHLDIAELWTNNGAFVRPHLKTLAGLMGLPGKAGFDGSQVHQAYKDGKLGEIDLYVMHDVYQTAFIFMRYRLLAGEIGVEAYLAAATALYEWIATKPEHKDFHASINPKLLFLREEEA